MPRCCVCDHCSEIDGPENNPYVWSEVEKGPVCYPCDQEIRREKFYDTRRDFDDKDPGPSTPFSIAETLEDDWNDLE